MEPFSSADLEFILKSLHQELPSEIIEKMVLFNDRLCQEILEEKSWGSQGGPWELNLRDMFR